MAVQIYTDLLKWALGRAGYHRYQKSRWIRFLATIATIHYFCFSLLFFAMDIPDTLNMLEIVWHKLV
jgi:hypothetical protein